MNNLRTVTLTQDEWRALDTFLLFTHSYGKQEQAIWERSATEMDEDGKPLYKNAAANANYWRELNATMERIKKEIRRAWVESNPSVA